jgi:hypothetical protein
MLPLRLQLQQIFTFGIAALHMTLISEMTFTLHSQL